MRSRFKKKEKATEREGGGRSEEIGAEREGGRHRRRGNTTETKI